MQDIDLGSPGPSQAGASTGTGTGSATTASSGSTPLKTMLQRWDFFRKVPKDLTESTEHGASLSLGGSLFLVILFLLEFNAYLTVTSSTAFALDRSMDEQLQINMEIQMTRLPCSFVQVEVQDFVGTHVMNVTKNIRLTRMDAMGQPIAEGVGHYSGGAGSHGRRLLSLPPDGGDAAVAGEEGDNDAGVPQAAGQNVAASAQAHTSDTAADAGATDTTTTGAEAHKTNDAAADASGEEKSTNGTGDDVAAGEGGQGHDGSPPPPSPSRVPAHMHPGYQPKTVQYEYKHGRLADSGASPAEHDGKTILVAQHSVASARAFCEDDGYCVGFSFRASSKAPAGQVMMTFRNTATFQSEVFKASQGKATWHTYIKKHMIPHDHPYHSGDQISLQLQAANFASTIHANEMVLVNYYAPWCIWCQRLSPVWEQFAAKLDETEYADVVQTGKVDCTAHESEQLCRQANVHAYPTISLFRNGQTESHMFYQGERSVAAFLEVVKDLMSDWVRGCNWRNTADCNPDGKRESENDRHCGADVPSGASGFCECVDRRITKKSTCQHEPINCKKACAALAPDDPGQTYDWKPATEQEFKPDSHGCVHWRATGGCSEHGPREPEHDKPCNAPIETGLSGYCECYRKDAKEQEQKKTHHFGVGCDHGVFTCDEACEAPDFSSFLSQHPVGKGSGPLGGAGGPDSRRLAGEAFKLGMAGASEGALLSAAQRLQRRAGGAEGCLVTGTLHVKKVPGKVTLRAHSVPKAAEAANGENSGDSARGHSFDATKLDMTHTVHHFSFGSEAAVDPPGRLQQPDMRRRLSRLQPRGTNRRLSRSGPAGLKLLDRLAGRTFESGAKSTTHQHYLKVVSTTFEFADQTPALQAYKYTATSHQHVEEFGELPTVRLAYNLDPMSLVEHEETRPLYHFITQLCAILGGVFTVLGILNSVIYHAQKRFSAAFGES